MSTIEHRLQELTNALQEQGFGLPVPAPDSPEWPIFARRVAVHYPDLFHAFHDLFDSTLNDSLDVTPPAASHATDGDDAIPDDPHEQQRRLARARERRAQLVERLLYRRDALGRRVPDRRKWILATVLALLLVIVPLMSGLQMTTTSSSSEASTDPTETSLAMAQPPLPASSEPDDVPDPVPAAPVLPPPPSAPASPTLAAPTEASAFLPVAPPTSAPATFPSPTATTYAVPPLAPEPEPTGYAYTPSAGALTLHNLQTPPLVVRVQPDPMQTSTPPGYVTLAQQPAAPQAALGVSSAAPAAGPVAPLVSPISSLPLPGPSQPPTSNPSSSTWLTAGPQAASAGAVPVLVWSAGYEQPVGGLVLASPEASSTPPPITLAAPTSAAPSGASTTGTATTPSTASPASFYLYDATRPDLAAGPSAAEPAPPVARPGQQLRATLDVAAIVPLLENQSPSEGQVPVFARTGDGLLWFGSAMPGTGSRVHLRFTQVFHPNGTATPVSAVALADDGAMGIPARVREVPVALAQDLFRAAVSGIAAYVDALTEAQTVQLGQNWTIVQQQVPDWEWFIAGNVARLFQLPPNQRALVRIAELQKGLDFTILVLPDGS